MHYKIGLKNEAKKYANILGYNYQSSEWYESSYIIFNKKYEENKIMKIKKEKEKSNSIFNRFMSLFG